MTLSNHVNRLPKIKATANELQALIADVAISADLRAAIGERAEKLVSSVRASGDLGMMELFLGEYGLSTDEGVALMCLAEALLRVPDSRTIDALIEDKIAPSAWDRHLGQSHSSLVNASTWALFVTGKLLDTSGDGGIVDTLHQVVKRVGEPVIREAVSRLMRELGQQFVFGETIEKAIKRAKKWKSNPFSYDMLGEAARTAADAQRYFDAYSNAIDALGQESSSSDIRSNHGISVKLSALHPRYEQLQRKRVMSELAPRVLKLAQQAATGNIGFNIDAEEAGRLELSLDVIEAVLRDESLKDWSGFGVVVQAYSPRARYVLQWLYELAEKLDRKIMVRLVKGAYWDTEIKHAQVEGHIDFPVFTHKPQTDVNYICCAKLLLDMGDRIYPQFATHNAHTLASIIELARDNENFEFQRLHGMGEGLHDQVSNSANTRCRIYAPVGPHRDLLAYLVRRLLENGANSSFVNQIVDNDIPASKVVADPFDALEGKVNALIVRPDSLFSPSRQNSKGWNLEDPGTLYELQESTRKFASHHWVVRSCNGPVEEVKNPSNSRTIGTINTASPADVKTALEQAIRWNANAKTRSQILRRAADFYEDNTAEIFSLLMLEAGKNIADCVGELREAVDFLRFYAIQAERTHGSARGVFACISPWNFPLAIFTGQMAAALAAGNGVLAKPAETTPLIASKAIELLHKAGVPKNVLWCLPGKGSEIGATLSASKNIDGMVFTGSSATAQLINRSMANNGNPSAPLIAETGGLNAMVVDSTALPEQAIADVVASAFQSAGQRCSALRVLYVQREIYEPFLEMLCGSMDELSLGDPTNLATDIGPVIDHAAQMKISTHIEEANSQGRLIKQIAAPENGYFIGPALIAVEGIEDLSEEIFGPVLHIAVYDASELEAVFNKINACGYGLTFGMHSRIDDRVQRAVDNVKAGNIYINRNQIGAVVGSQPFGGEGLSGTGPKAGGPAYIHRFRSQSSYCLDDISGRAVEVDEIDRAFGQLLRKTVAIIPPKQMPGPTGELNTYSLHPRDRILCLGPGAEAAEEQARKAQKMGCRAIALAPGIKEGIDGSIAPEILQGILNLDAVIGWHKDLRPLRMALSNRQGKIVPLLNEDDFERWLLLERHTCVDTTASGGNAQLLAGE